MLRISVVALASLLSPPVLTATMDKGLPAPGSSITLEPTSDGYETTIDVDAKEGYADVKLHSGDARLAGILTGTAIKAQRSPDTVKRVVIGVKRGNLRHGPYSITLLATRIQPVEIVERDVSLVVPPATLEAPATLVIRRVCDGIVVRNDCYGRNLRIGANQPQLWESTQRHWLTGIALEQKGDTDAGGQTAGILREKNSLVDAKPGTNPRIKYDDNVQLDGSFPLGTAKGKIVIRADQLAAPVAMDFEVQTRTTRWILVWVLLLGLVLGWFTRRFLSARLELRQEQQNTFALLSLIDITLARTADDATNRALRDVRTQAHDALAAKTAEDTKTKTAAAQKAFLDQQEAIRVRRAAMDQVFADVLAVLRTRWKIPAPLTDAVNKAIGTAEAILAERTRNDFTREATELDRAVQQVFDVAQPEAKRCSGTAVSVAHVKTVLITLVNAATADALQSLGQPPAAVAGLDAPSGSLKARIDVLRQSLEYVHMLTAWIDDTCSALRGNLLSHTAAWESRLAVAELLERDTWVTWLDDARKLAEQLNAGSIVAGGNVPVEPASALVRQLGDVLRIQVANIDVDSINELVNKGAYDEAITRVARLRPTVTAAGRPSALESRDSGGEAAATVMVSPAAPIFARSTQGLPSVAYGVAPTPGYDTASLALLAAATERSVAVSHLLLQAIYAAIIVAGGYFLLGDKWVGTPLDIAVAFFWAYATDIGADAATAAVRGLKR